MEANRSEPRSAEPYWEARALRWIEAVQPLLGRPGPLTAREAEAWRRRLPALIAGGELLRYHCRTQASGGDLSELLSQTLEEARCLQTDLTAQSDAPATRTRPQQPRIRRERPAAEVLERASLLVWRSAARREIETLVGDAEAPVRLPPALSVAIPPGRPSGLQGFNLCFFAFLCFQTLLWGTGLLHGADAPSVVLYALILAPFWWWGGYLLQALALAVSPEQLLLTGRRARLKRSWLGSTEFELIDDGAEPVRRECWFELNLRPVHCLTLYGPNGRRARFAVGREPSEHERLLREIQEHLRRVQQDAPPD